MSRFPTPNSSDQPVLVPVDFEPAARAALIFGARLAAFTGVPLKILHVVHDPGDRPGYYRRHGESDLTMPVERLARSMLGEFVLDILQDHPDLKALEEPDILLVEGIPSTRIPEVARRIGAGLIAMGHNKTRGIFGDLLTSLSERVAHKSGIPVTLVYANGESEDLAAVANTGRRPVDRGMVPGA